jgi:hypothetical protein
MNLAKLAIENRAVSYFAVLLLLVAPRHRMATS